MEKILRRRFIISSVRIVFTVLVVILLAVNVINYFHLKDRFKAMIEVAMVNRTMTMSTINDPFVYISSVSQDITYAEHFEGMLYDFAVASVIAGSLAFVAIAILIVINSKRVVAVITEGYEKQKQFITGVTHELKTPLTIIKGNAEVIGMQSGHTMWTKSTIEQINRLNMLIEYLISLTKLEESGALHKAKFSLSELLQENCLFFEGIAASQDKYIEYEVQPGIDYNGDIQNIELLVSILLENALKYSIERGRVKVALRLIKNRPVLYISNRSEDLEIRKYNEWFDRFYRADISRNSNNSGFGIGLAMAKTIVERHKGKITAESLDGRIIIIKIIF